ncbi:MAG: UDP-N-acetylglucosamine 2-epimerase (non-hydrolyzing) [bacterium]|nr:UDP-N-acetylglucosamine 2-epimerase (non-hydrolyzing) [bacterium]
MPSSDPDRSTGRKIMVVVGTRPEAIKLAPVILELKKRPAFKTFVVATAQHREMLDQVLEIFRIKPDADLDLMTPNQTLFDVTGRAVKAFEAVLNEVRPDCVLVQGDTTTAFVGALAAFYHKAAVGHVEAGLRTGNKYFPFPEEVNRKMVTAIADYHFAPTESNRRNLLAEGVPDAAITVTGNTVIDALLMTVEPDFSPKGFTLPRHQGLILVTAHRRENFGEPLEAVLHAVRDLAGLYPHHLFVYPVHMNRNVQKPANAILSKIDNVMLLPPLDYRTFSNLMAMSTIVLTDSGGIQEEAPSLGKPVLVLRNETERPEAVEAGTVMLVGPDRERIVREVRRLLDDRDAYDRMARAVNPYGDGKASVRIADFLEKRMEQGLNA